MDEDKVETDVPVTDEATKPGEEQPVSNPEEPVDDDEAPAVKLPDNGDDDEAPKSEAEENGDDNGEEDE